MYFRVLVTRETLQFMVTWTLTPPLQCPLGREAILPRPLSTDHPYPQDDLSEQNVLLDRVYKIVQGVA